MQKEDQQIQIYPKFDSQKSKDKFQKGQVTKILTNYYKIVLEKKLNQIQQFSIGFEPEVPSDATKLVEKIMESIKGELKIKAGYLCFKGRMLWGRVKSELAMITKASIQIKGQTQEYQVILKPVKCLSTNEFILQDPQNANKLSQVLNINIKNVLKKMNFRELDQGKYYKDQQFELDKIQDAKLSIWRGYQINVTPIKNQLFLKVDVCSRILRLENFLETMKNTGKIKDKAYINQTFQGVSVIARYGTHRIFKVVEIDYSMSPKLTFDNYHSQQKQTFVEYYKSTYQCAIKDLDQPLIKIIVKNCEKQQIQYLIPELVCLTGLTDQQRSDFSIMKKVAQYTKLKVQQRVSQTNNIVKDLNKQATNTLMFSIQEKAHQSSAVIANTPQIQVARKKFIQPNEGVINLRDQILDPIYLRQYFFVYTSRGAKDDDDAGAAYSYMNKASKTFGIRLEQPIWIDIRCGRNDRLSARDWIESIEQQLSKGRPEFVILYFNFDEMKDKQLYQKLKSYLIHNLQLNSQVITKKTLSGNAKGGLSKASKILLQINDKMGHPLYKIEKQHSYWAKNSLAIGSLASSNGPKGTTMSFVGTRNNDLTQHFSDFSKISKKQEVPKVILMNFISGWLRQYFKFEGKKLPDTIILYREGLNEKQAEKVLKDEIQVMQKVFEQVCTKASKPGWRPKFMYILVNQKTGTRAYNIDRNGRLDNPLPGTIIGSEMSKDNSYEFLMASALTTEGTCNMVHYKVAYDSSKQEIPHQALKLITYEQCYNYPNWAGSIRFPAPLQKANKLAKFVSTHGEDNIDKTNPLKGSDYYI